jgi:hypothetical protein
MYLTKRNAYCSVRCLRVRPVTACDILTLISICNEQSTQYFIRKVGWGGSYAYVEHWHGNYSKTTV